MLAVAFLGPLKKIYRKVQAERPALQVLRAFTFLLRAVTSNCRFPNISLPKHKNCLPSVIFTKKSEKSLTSQLE